MIRVHEVAKRFGEQEVLRGISLDVVKGEVAAIIGPSGGGKSTLLRCIIGLESFDSGRVELVQATIAAGLAGRERARIHRRLRGKVGMVFQQFHLFPHLTVLENVTAAPIYVNHVPQDEANSRAMALLARVGVAAKAGCRPDRLSGGEQQRVAIARALAMDPEIILFDEPTSALDPCMTDEVLGVMTDLAAAGQSMLVVTHEMGFARRVANRVHVFADGRVVESGLAAEVFEAPREVATRRFLRLATA
ncbi:MAG: amino acid ABC transporter ATP-binding protein [Deltaproteobacteria bacterium]|nr:amino acid ABC transporter ATP-binding protein [Deltaproteobacteria bacterium]